MPRLAYSYVRYSTLEQKKGDSATRQIELSRDYCKTHGLILDESLVDEGVSAYRGKNAATGALGSFLREVKAGRVARGSFLLVESLDRLSRQDIETALGQFLAIVKSGITIVTVTDGMTYKTGHLNMNELIISISVMSRAHEESKRKAERIAAAWIRKRKKAQVERLTSLCPKWLEPSGTAGVNGLGMPVSMLTFSAFGYVADWFYEKFSPEKITTDYLPSKKAVFEKWANGTLFVDTSVVALRRFDFFLLSSLA
ncbi:recombinase family protein [Oleiharenicola lentus]|uniref:recombinase family protein n=1 Tax=Oleiharenicola lentus TaxID=2508720 RepID=UPI003F66383E